MKRVLILCVSMLFLAGSGLTASANSAQTHWMGTDGAGVMATGACPVEITRETLTFELWEFPDSYYETAEDFAAYSGRVSAEYTFHNPSDLTVTAGLAFPFGQLPTYAPDWGQGSDDAGQVEVSADGAELERGIRHTYKPRFEPFLTEKDLALLEEGYTEDPFLGPDLPVKRMRFTVFGTNDANLTCHAAFDWLPDEGLKLIFPQMTGGKSRNDGSVRLSAGVKEGSTLEVLVLGWEDFVPEWNFYRSGSCQDG